MNIPTDSEGRELNVPAHLNLTLENPSNFLGTCPDCKLDFFTNARGYRIASYFWPAAGSSPRGIVCIIHGHGAYLTFNYLKSLGPGKLCQYEGSWVHELNKQGYSVCGIDNQGAGRSDGTRCYTECFEHLVQDLVQHIERTRGLGRPGFPQGVPWFLLGASMGGCLATLTAITRPDLVSGIILLAPMLSLEKVKKKGLNPYLLPIARLVSALAPKLPAAAASRNTLYPDLQAAYDQDPNNWHFKTRARNAYEYLRVTSQLMAPGGLEALTTPVIVFHGLLDDMCDQDGSKALYLRAKSEDKTLHLLEGFWHVLVHEPGNEQILDTIITWLSQHIPIPTGTPPPPGATSPSRADTDTEAEDTPQPEPSKLADAAMGAQPGPVGLVADAHTASAALEGQ